MKLKNLPLIVFDELPLTYIPQQRVVLTHLFNIEKQIVPSKLDTIITTHYIANQLKEYYTLKRSRFTEKINFIYVEPYKYIDIVLPGRRTLQLLFCESEERTRNLMVLIREDGKLQYIYAGNFLDIRSALMNDTFASWIERESVPQLYINLKRCLENPQVQDIDPINKVFDAIQNILDCHTDSVLHMYLPLFGYDNFIYNLSHKFRKRISISSEFKPYPNVNKQLLSDSLEKAKIIVFAGEPPTTQEILRDLHKTNRIIINIQQEYKSYDDMTCEPTKELYSLYYTPEPTPFHLQFLCLLLKPKRLHGIIGKFNINATVPMYLIELCDTTTSSKRSKRQSRFNESLRTQTQSTTTNRTEIIGTKKKTNVYLDDSESD